MFPEKLKRIFVLVIICYGQTYGHFLSFASPMDPKGCLIILFTAVVHYCNKLECFLLTFTSVIDL